MPIAQALVAAGHHVIGADINRGQLALARQTVPGALFTQMDLGALGLAEGSLQAVVLFYALFHLPREQHARVLADLWRALASGGWLLASLGAEAWEGEELFCGVPMRWSHWGSDTYLLMLADQGFHIPFHQVDTSHDERHLIVLAQRPLSPTPRPTDHA
jgi:SAM-dependent methyltransferase